MARRSLKPQLNQIRAWVHQGRTDAWIAHQLEVSASELREFRKQHELTPEGGEESAAEVDLRDEIEAEVEAATEEAAAEEEPEEEEAKAEEPEAEEPEAEEPEAEEPEAGEEEAGKAEEPRKARRPERGKAAEKAEEKPRKPRRRRRGGRGRRRRKELEATFDHGERDGYGIWLDPAVKDNPIYADRWAGKREVTVRIEPDQIVIRRAGEGGSNDSGT